MKKLLTILLIVAGAAIGLGLSNSISNSNAAWIGIPRSGAPPAATAYVTSFTGGSVRNDFNCAAGVKITVGGTGVTVTELGRWVVSGNSASHTVYLCTGTAGAPPTVLGSVTVNTSGAPTGAFLYATLSSPIALSPSTTYYILSSELNLGDEWYNANITPTVTGITTAFEAAYTTGTIAGNITDTGLTTSFYVPVNFKYTIP